MDAQFDEGHLRHSSARAPGYAPAHTHHQTSPYHPYAPGRVNSAVVFAQGIPAEQPVHGRFPRGQVNTAGSHARQLRRK